MDKEVEGMDESMKAMQRRLEEVEKNKEGKQNFAPGGNAETQNADQDQINPATMAGAAGGTAGLGTDQESGGNLGAPTGTGYHGHVGGGGAATENNS
ncbi:hypothetical protein AAE02nite_18800 [Adhaeribacter aerolatus]|uniref:Uncharacterized protein n=1 Tax=Adhaeribacter aerolatus TaxID=670289 RepID=A0A512AWW9_9BACT|nr:hypothetical protein [Adhaeribacter aerolatus]GEO04216.1 hypothetical protein AAE02nite_18800 [Adhaeribacter aerolatus]